LLKLINELAHRVNAAETRADNLQLRVDALEKKDKKGLFGSMPFFQK
jgi:hypothetical protein